MPCLFAVLKFVIGHIARYAPSSKFQNQQKYRSKIGQLILSPLLKTPNELF